MLFLSLSESYDSDSPLGDLDLPVGDSDLTVGNSDLDSSVGD